MLSSVHPGLEEIVARRIECGRKVGIERKVGVNQHGASRRNVRLDVLNDPVLCRRGNPTTAGFDLVGGVESAQHQRYGEAQESQRQDGEGYLCADARRAG